MNNLTFAGSPLTGAWPEQCPLGHRLEWVTLDGQTWLMCEEWNCRFGKQPGPTREEYRAAFGERAGAADRDEEGRKALSLREEQKESAFGAFGVRALWFRQSPPGPRYGSAAGPLPPNDFDPPRPARRTFGMLRRRAWIMVLAAALAVGGVAAQQASQAPQYRAEVSLMVRPQLIIAPAASGDSSLSTVQSAYRQTVLNNVMHLLGSRTLVDRVAGQVQASGPEELSRHIGTRNIPGTDFIILSAVDGRPDRAAQIANAMALGLIDFYSELNRAEAASARKFIEEQLALAQDRLGAAEQALSEFQSQTGALALPEEISHTGQRILDLQAAYDAAMLNAASADSRVAAIRSHLAAQRDGRFASVSIATNPVVAQIRDHLTGLELQLASLRQMYTDEHPKVQMLLGRIADDRRRLNAEAAKVVNDTSSAASPIREQFVREMVSGEVDADTARAKAAGITPILSRLQARLSTVSKNELALLRLQRSVRVDEQLFTEISSLRRDALIRESKAASAGQAALVVVDQATPPGRPVPNQLPAKAASAGLLGLLGGAALALGIDRFENRTRSRPGPAAAGLFGAPALPQAEEAYGVTALLSQTEGGYSVPMLAAIPMTSDAQSRTAPAAAPGNASTLLLPIVLAVLMLGMIAGVYTAITTMPGITAGGERWMEQHRQAAAFLTAAAGALHGAVQAAAESLRIAGREMMQQLAGTIVSGAGGG